MNSRIVESGVYPGSWTGFLSTRGGLWSGVEESPRGYTRFSGLIHQTRAGPDLLLARSNWRSSHRG